MKKALLLILFIALMITFSFGLLANNQEVKNKSTKIKLYELTINVPYEKEDIIVIRKELKDEVQVTIKNKNNKEVLETLGELKEKKYVNTNKKLSDSGNTYLKTVYSSKIVKPTESRLYAVLEIYSTSRLIQINKVVDTYWLEGSSGNWRLDDKHSNSYMKKTPDTKVTILGTANIIIETSYNVSGDFSISALEKLGFSVMPGINSNYNSRRPIEHSYTFSLYKKL